MDEILELKPKDKYNSELLSNVHPPDWVDPKPAKRYHLVVLGGGTAGLVAALGAAGLGAKVALVEKHFLGGDCLNYGCVPSKALIRSARYAADAKNSRNYGIDISGGVEADFAKVMERVRKIRSRISSHDSAKRLKDLGVDVFLGEARFSGPGMVTAGKSELRFKKAVIATGARPSQLPITGLSEAGYLTNETVFSLTERPRRLAVIGGGPIGCELAQAFQRLGSEVVVFHNADHILSREDGDAARIVQDTMISEGVKFNFSSKIEKIEKNNNEKIIHYSINGRKDSAAVDEILVAAGRTPNIDELNLEAVSVKYDKRKGVIVDDRLRTTNKRIYASGDVCMNWKFTHAADAASRIVIQNALFFGRKKLSSLIMPWCTYTDPEIAHVGIYKEEASQKGVKLDTYIREFKEVDRAITDGENGFVKVHTSKGGGEILGATIVARSAGEMINEITLAMAKKAGLGDIANVIHPYPTQAEAVKQAGDMYNRSRLTPTAKKVFAWWFRG